MTGAYDFKSVSASMVYPFSFIFSILFLTSFLSYQHFQTKQENPGVLICKKNVNDTNFVFVQIMNNKIVQGSEQKFFNEMLSLGVSQERKKLGLLLLKNLRIASVRNRKMWNRRIIYPCKIWKEKEHRMKKLKQNLIIKRIKPKSDVSQISEEKHDEDLNLNWRSIFKLKLNRALWQRKLGLFS